ncbi:MAG: hypothetical protein J0H30_14025 [Alphaproteobacteria bacterium]|nr:hypothetical protein [Alphaproteobacteria bacterium]
MISYPPAVRANPVSRRLLAALLMGSACVAVPSAHAADDQPIVLGPVKVTDGAMANPENHGSFRRNS